MRKKRRFFCWSSSQSWVISFVDDETVVEFLLQGLWECKGGQPTLWCSWFWVCPHEVVAPCVICRLPCKLLRELLVFLFFSHFYHISLSKPFHLLQLCCAGSVTYKTHGHLLNIWIILTVVWVFVWRVTIFSWPLCLTEQPSWMEHCCWLPAMRAALNLKHLNILLLLRSWGWSTSSFCKTR